MEALLNLEERNVSTKYACLPTIAGKMVPYLRQFRPKDSHVSQRSFGKLFKKSFITHRRITTESAATDAPFTQKSASVVNLIQGFC